MSPRNRNELEKYLKIYNYRLEHEKIRFWEDNEGQAQFEKLFMVNSECAFFAGNGSGKTAKGANIVVRCALGSSAGKYEQTPVMRDKSTIWVGSPSIDVQMAASEKAILDLLPEKEIEHLKRGSQGEVGVIKLKNGSEIVFKTYKQGRELWQGGNVDLIWLDEEAPEDVFKEALARLRGGDNPKLIYTMTPLKGFTQPYKYFVEAGRAHMFCSTDVNRKNLPQKYIEEKLTGTDTEIQMRRHGLFSNPTGLMLSDWNRSVHVIDHIVPSKKETIFIGGYDFGTTHPSAVVFCAIDLDQNVYVFREWKGANSIFNEQALEILPIQKEYGFRVFYADPSGKQAILELRQRGVFIRAGMNDKSVGYTLLRELLRTGKLFVSRECVNLIYEIENMTVKEEKSGGTIGKDGEEGFGHFDLVSALRYAVTSFFKMKPTKELKPEEKTFVQHVRRRHREQRQGQQRW